MFTLSRACTRFLALAFAMSIATSAWAESTILSGMFDGAEPTMNALHRYNCEEEPLGYIQTKFQVSVGGTYTVRDAFEQFERYGAVTVYHRLYQGSFNPAAPDQNRKGGIDIYNLSPGVTYVLVMHSVCENREGPWAMAVIGPGPVNSDSAVPVPNFTRGRFTASDPTRLTNPYTAEKGPYKQFGPIRVSRSGTYFFNDVLPGAQVSLHVYRAPFDPADPSANQVASAAYGMPLVELTAEQDYYFVTQWISGSKEGEFSFVLAPPAALRINPGLTGAWHNPDTPGQGYFLTVYEQLNKVFLSWFTFKNESSADDKFGHRWVTAFGDFEGPSADLDIELMSGGSFDAAVPEPVRSMVGNIRLEFTDCASGRVIYDVDSDDAGTSAASGVIPIQRLANDSVALCESLYAGPGMPGPL